MKTKKASIGLVHIFPSRGKKALTSFEKILAIILIILTLTAATIFVQRGDISSKLKNLLPDYGFEDDEDLGDVGPHISIEVDEEKQDDLIERIEEQGTISKGLEIITDVGVRDIEDKLIVLWNFPEEKPVIWLYPNKKEPKLIISELPDVNDKINNVPEDTLNQIKVIYFKGANEGLKEMASYIASQTRRVGKFGGRKFKVNNEGRDFSTEEVLKEFLKETKN